LENSIIIVDDEDLRKLQNLCDAWLSNPSIVLDFYNHSYNSREIRREIETVLPKDYEFSEHLVRSRKTALAAAKMLQKTELRNTGWAEIFKQIQEEDPLSTYVKEESILCCSRDGFEEECKNFIKDTIACINH
jgi:hypothetical protein